MLSIHNLNFSYTPDQPLLKGVTFHIQSKEKVCILGESGSGKSTLLKLIHAELDKDSGRISFNHKEIKGPSYQLIPGHEDIKYVPQDFQLEQYVTVTEIVGKHISNIDGEYKKKRVKQVLEALSISDLADKKQAELSGGQKQRVAIARAIANPPQLLLLDEPFSQLDSSLHLSVRDQLMQYLTKNNIAVLFTSHRSDDALGYSDKILLMKEGKILQQDRPQQVYQHPANRYIAGLFGEVNIYPRDEAHTLGIPSNYFKKFAAVYPEEIEITPDGKITARVRYNRYQGSRYLITFSYKGIAIKAYSPNRLEVDSTVNLSIEKYRWVD
ncbi:ATP-binding cassette domain-containing protein [Flavobacteriaceae bacterium Ap0902]|nr:ATP-binding cassette domain-containing protein [Flavobacteriaceae bacterium Ap0902]